MMKRPKDFYFLFRTIGDDVDETLGMIQYLGFKRLLVGE